MFFYHAFLSPDINMACANKLRRKLWVRLKTLDSLPGSDRAGSATISGYQVQVDFNLLFDKFCNKIMVGNKQLKITSCC